MFKLVEDPMVEESDQIHKTNLTVVMLLVAQTFQSLSNRLQTLEEASMELKTRTIN
jgi:predicted lactoylglutathione lyase